MALANFIGEGRVYTGASVTSSELSLKHVCEELMKCAASVGLTVSSVLASQRQFIAEMSQGEEDLGRIFYDTAGRPQSAGSPASS